MTTRSRLTLKSAPFICDTGRVAIYLAFASLIPPTALRLWAPPVHVATGGHGPRRRQPVASAAKKQNKLFCSWSSQLMTEGYFPVYWPMKKMAPVLTSVIT